MHSPLRIVLVTAIVWLGCGDDVKQSLDPVEPSLTFVDGITHAVDLTPDGKTALLQNYNADAQVWEAYFFETARGELALKTQVGDFERIATGISANKKIAGFHGTPIQAALWSEEDGWRELGSGYETNCDPAASSAWDISADGSVIVGLDWDGCHSEGFLWTDDGGAGTFTALATLGIDGGSSRATVVSDDGRVAAGFAQLEMVDRVPAVWQANGEGIVLDDSNDVVGEVLSISADGGMVAGLWNMDGFYWTEADGVQSIGKLDGALGSDSTYPNAIAADGELIFGGCGDAFFGVMQAFVWTKDRGMRPLLPLIEAAGLPLPQGITLTNVMAASADGTVVLGEAVDETFTPSVFVLRLPVSAYE